MVPGTPHGLVNDKPVEERSMVMGAVSPDRENVGPSAHNEHLLVPNVADQLAPVGELGEGNSLRQIGADRSVAIFSHIALLQKSMAAIARAATAVREQRVVKLEHQMDCRKASLTEARAERENSRSKNSRPPDRSKDLLRGWFGGGRPGLNRI